MATKKEIIRNPKKAPNKYDWEKLKHDFITGDWNGIKHFKRYHNISQNLTLPFRGWLEERRKYQYDLERSVSEKLGGKSEVSPQEIRERQARLARFMQLKAAMFLEGAPIKDAEEARKMLVAGLQEERKALGLDQSTTQTLTQVNIGVKTNFDKIIQNLDYEGVLRFIANIKRERDRRIAQSGDVASPAKAEEGKIL